MHLLDQDGVELSNPKFEKVSALLFLVTPIPGGGLSIADATRFGAKIQSDGSFVATASERGQWALVVIAAGYCPVTVMTKVALVVEVYLVAVKRP